MIKSAILPIVILLSNFTLSGQELFHSVSGQISSAIVRIETEENVGTGFIVRNNGTIVTALGIIDGAAHVRITTENREVYDNVSLLAKDERRGIAIIRTAGFGLPNVDFGDSDNLGQQQILMIGRSFASAEMSLTTRLSRVLGVNYSDRGHKVISIADPIPNEVFGGPIVDSEGRVIAIAVSQEDWKFVIPINDIRGLLDYAEHNRPIAQWESKPVDVNPWRRFLIFWRGILTSIYNIYPWLISILVVGFVVYCLMSLVYSKRASKAEKHPKLAPISVRGKQFADFSTRDAVTLINAHMLKLEQITTSKKMDIDVGKIASLGEVKLPVEMIILLYRILGDTRLPPFSPPKIGLPDVAEIGGFKIPIGLMTRLTKILFSWIPMRSLKLYQNALINISLFSTDSEAHLLMWRGSRYLESWVPTSSEGSDAKSYQTNSYGRTGSVNLLRDAVFMILELTQDKTLPGRNWSGKKYFVDGLECLDRLLKSGKSELLDVAVENFFHAAEEDDENNEALYIKGHILNAQREKNSNALAEGFLTRALNTEKPQLKALIHAGLANCHAQRYFRLAMRRDEVIEKAQGHVKDAYRYWKQANEKQQHPWILAADAFVRVLNAMSKKNRDEQMEPYREAAELYFQAIELEKNNSAYSNALGFILLWFTEQEYTELDIGIPQDDLNIPQQSEHYLKISLELDPRNKLARANLCRLYATDWYRNKDRQKYLELSRASGLEAVKHDDDYINGFRDLAISLLRYGEIKEAHDYFKLAMEKAEDNEKKKEIKCEVESVLDDRGKSIWRQL